MALEARIGDFGAQRPRPSPSKSERAALLAALSSARELERALSSLGSARPHPVRRERIVLAAAAAAAGLGPEDRLLAPHRLLSAHLARGVEPLEVAAARLGLEPRRGSRIGFRGGIGPDTVVALSVGRAAGLRRKAGGEAPASVSLVERPWSETPGCRRALALARELALPLVTVVIDGDPPPEAERAETIPSEDFEAILGAVRAAIENARADEAPAVIQVAHLGGDGQSVRNHVADADRLAAYRRRLAMHGLSRAEVDALDDRARATIRSALAELGVLAEEDWV